MELLSTSSGFFLLFSYCMSLSLSHPQSHVDVWVSFGRCGSSLENLDNLPLMHDNQEVDISVDGGADIYGISLSLNKNVAGFHVLSNLTLTDSEHKGYEETSKLPLDYGHIFSYAYLLILHCNPEFFLKG